MMPEGETLTVSCPPNVVIGSESSHREHLEVFYGFILFANA